MSKELNLLADALTTQGEVEDGPVRYIYMDDSTIYRFENNQMKKVTANMIKRAQKLIDNRNANPTAKPKAKAKSRKVPEPVPEPDEVEEEEAEDEEVIPEPIKVPKKKKPQRPRTAVAAESSAANIDLNEYYSNKSKMEYMNLELQRLNSKVHKLKQYKSIVSRLTGGEFEAIEPQQQMCQQSERANQQQMNQQQMNQSNSRCVCDSLFI